MSARAAVRDGEDDREDTHREDRPRESAKKNIFLCSAKSFAPCCGDFLLYPARAGQGRSDSLGFVFTSERGRGGITAGSPTTARELFRAGPRQRCRAHRSSPAGGATWWRRFLNTRPRGRSTSFVEGRRLLLAKRGKLDDGKKATESGTNPYRGRPPDPEVVVAVSRTTTSDRIGTGGRNRKRGRPHRKTLLLFVTGNHERLSTPTRIGLGFYKTDAAPSGQTTRRGCMEKSTRPGMMTAVFALAEDAGNLSVPGGPGSGTKVLYSNTRIGGCLDFVFSVQRLAGGFSIAPAWA